MKQSKQLRILTWHVHGSYLWYLSQVPHEFLVPVKQGRPPGYAGVSGSLPWPPNIREVPAEEVGELELDVVLTQSHRNWSVDRNEILSDRQMSLPRIHLEHDPPRESPTDTRHVVDDPGALLVHVTHFNDLMWDSGSTPTRVIEHGVMVPDDVRYSGHLDKGLVVVNCLGRRGRRLGVDVFESVRGRVPLDLIGMEAEEMGGLGEVKPPGAAEFAARYRFFFNPIRYTSLGLAVCEAMMTGMPVIGLATTEMATAVQNGVSGWVDTDVERLVEIMKELIADPAKARRWGDGARRVAKERFSIDRFARDWDRTLCEAAAGHRATGISAPNGKPSLAAAATRPGAGS